MKTAGIICEYNPIHFGHVRHIAETRALIGGDSTIICVMSGNFVQRGDLAIFEKHARAASAVAAGADLVLELPLPYVLSSAEGFGRGGVMLLEALGVCDFISFGSEAGEIKHLKELAEGLLSDGISERIKEVLKSGVSYAQSRQIAVMELMGQKAELLKSPNNILAIEYLKALIETKSAMEPLTIRRLGSAHDSDGAESASALRRYFKEGKEPWHVIPDAACDIFKNEIALGRGPVFTEAAESAILSRLRMIPEEEFARLPDASEGLNRRLLRFSKSMPSIQSILENTKTKRYAMSRLRRMLMCAVLGIHAEDSLSAPPYIRVLALNKKGMSILREIKQKTKLPVITKPAAAALGKPAKAMFQKESDSTDFYALAYPKVENRSGGQEWTMSPRIFKGGKTDE